MKNKDWQFRYGSSRKNKLWISAYKVLGEFKDEEGNLLKNTYQLASIELNTANNQARIVWVVESKDCEFTIELPKAEEQELIQSAYTFAKDRGYIDRILNRNK